MQIYEIENLHLDEMQITANNCKVLLLSELIMREKKKYFCIFAPR